MHHTATFLILILASAVPSWSQVAIDESSIELKKIDPVERDAPNDSPIESPHRLQTSDVINTGLKVWKIIADNKPVVDIQTQYATALPLGVTQWQHMEGWQIPKSDTYHLTAKNLVGLTVINVRYQVLRTYGGSYKGKGKYLTAVGVQPLLVDVAWGYHFSMDAFIPDESIVNVGRADDPIAALTAQVKWRISTPVQDTQGQGFPISRRSPSPCRK
jgi:hypothetical protein